MANKDVDRSKQPPQSKQDAKPAAGRKNAEEVGEPVQLNEDIGEPVQLDEDASKQQPRQPGAGPGQRAGQPGGPLPGQPGGGPQQGNR